MIFQSGEMFMIYLFLIMILKVLSLNHLKLNVVEHPVVADSRLVVEVRDGGSVWRHPSGWGDRLEAQVYQARNGCRDGSSDH